mmetsp:Transcript_23054/g.34380  ORF Transcript_23054/g.34380 Transcript_23054/m.34380 type:complete len:81 (+) Transcript_23054:238-480(+)
MGKVVPAKLCNDDDYGGAEEEGKTYFHIPAPNAEDSVGNGGGGPKTPRAGGGKTTTNSTNDGAAGAAAAGGKKKETSSKT